MSKKRYESIPFCLSEYQKKLNIFLIFQNLWRRHRVTIVY